MKSKVVFLAVLFFCSGMNVQAQSSEILTRYSLSSKLVHYCDRDITIQSARFDSPYPCSIRSIVVTLGGMGTGNARLRIFGQEGGASVPMLEQDMVRPVQLQKKVAGPQTFTVEFAQGIPVPNNQFFIAVDSLPQEVFLLSDTITNKPSCSSPGAEEYFFQCIKTTNGVWRYGRSAYLISAEIHYDKQEPVFVCDTLAVGLAAGQYGISCIDINNDGFPDILASSRLFLNDGEGSFIDRTQELGIEQTSGFCLVIDIDNDGRLDILFLSPNSSVSTLYVQNEKGEFINRQIALPRLENPTCYSVSDVNFDGFPDLFIGQASLSDNHPLNNYLLVNTGNLSFEIMHFSFNERTGASANGSMFVDTDNDGRAELFIANGPGRNDELWKNDGRGNFVPITGTEHSETGFSATRGCHIGYSHNQLTPDFLFPQAVGLMWKMRSDEDAVPRFSSSVVSEDIPGENKFTAIEYEEKHSGGAWGDINNDGVADFIITTSCPCRYADVYIGQDNGTFRNETVGLGLDFISDTHDALWADIDNNGALDLLVITAGELRVYKQNTAMYNYVGLDLRGSAGISGAIGARATVYSNGESFTRSVVWGRGLFMGDPLRLHYGLGANHSIDSVVVQWPGSVQETFAGPEVNTITTLVQGRGLHNREVSEAVSPVQAYPNPFSKVLTMSCMIQERGRLQVSIFSATGLKIVELHNAPVEAGLFVVQWNGNDGSGNKVASGRYIYRFILNGSTRTGNINIIE
jgi:hypothetical protein